VLFVVRHLSKSKKTTIRLTEADRTILQRLTDLTGLKQSQVIRAALRALLRRVERPVEK
jgi:Arc/MetJ-type ribon-helix-helix transcriptional regulator